MIRRSKGDAMWSEPNFSRTLASICVSGASRAIPEIALGCSSASVRVTHDQRPFQPQPFDEPPHDFGLLRQPAGGAARPHRMAGARAVERDQAIARTETAKQRMAEMVELRAEAVQEDDRPALAFLDIVDAIAVDFDELSQRRHQPLGLGGDPPCRQHQAGGYDDRQQKQAAEQPGQDRQQHFPPTSDAGTLSAADAAARL
jgi:hypothetical protein